jgi:hypothetical protein
VVVRQLEIPMPLLRFTNPVGLPVYEDWSFEIQPSRITLHAEDLRDVYAAYCENHRQYYNDIPKEWPRYTEFLRVSQLHAKLEQACREGRDVEMADVDYVWSFCSGLMFDMRFVRVGCPACGQEYSPAECSVEEWWFGEGLAAAGGRRLFCPAGHTVYSCGEWVS